MKDLSNRNFNEVLNLIKSSKQKAFTQINTILVELYWNIGKYISIKTIKENWGKSVVKDLAIYIKAKDPSIKGFSDRNLWTMKQFYEAYPNNKKVPSLVAELSWTHNRRILSLKTKEEKEFYLTLCNKQKYSVRELNRLISSGTYERTILSNDNLSKTIKELPQSIDGVFKDSYVFEFLDLAIPYKEIDLQKALILSLKDFILELGIGFTFVGQEYKVEVGNRDFSIDLLFFHRGLQCLVAFELKTDEFSPSYLGQLEFYLEALDQDVKLPHENPTIGVLLCREKNDEIVKYALNRSVSPTLIADFETKLIPKKLLQNKLNEFYERLKNK